MTEQEAIELLQNLNVKLTDMAGHKTNGIEKIFGWNEITAICEAIKALEEVQQYRAIGTPEECLSAVEKQIAKKPKEYEDKFYGCPTCGNVLLHKWEKYPTKLMDKKNGLPYCLGCGQKLDWSDEE